MEIVDCPNCGTKLKNGLLSSIKLLDASKMAVVNEYHEPKSSAYCNKCGDILFAGSLEKLIAERNTLITEVTPAINYIPAITTLAPHNWQYEAIGIVTGQAVTSTSFFQEATQSLTEILDDNPNSLNFKLRSSEHLCYFQVRKQALDYGGNAVMGVNISYTELNGARNLMMVGMTGTAIKLKNVEILGEGRAQKLVNLAIYNSRYRYLTRLQHKIVHD